MWHYELVAADIAGRITSGRVLDIGTGPGRLLIKIHEKAPGLSVYGVDISAAMVAKAEENLSEAGLAGNITVREAGVASLPFDDNYFDLVASTASFHHWKDPVAGLNEIHRVLRPGGTALVYDLVADTPDGVFESMKRQYGKFPAYLMWMHAFEEPFYTMRYFREMPLSTSFKGGDARFVGAFYCMVLRKDGGNA
jgi:ubiquinone/menaquinone biosynthesis C-methylase UbiE